MKQTTKFDDGTWKTELRKISDLKPNPKNPRTITKDTIKPLRQSMRDNGYTDRIMIDNHNMILSGHGRCTITGETSVHIPTWFVKDTVRRISKERIRTKYIEVPQDKHLAANQEKEFRCGDNGVFAGYPMPKVHKIATDICQDLYEKAPYDGKIVLELKKDGDKLTICWSNVRNADLKAEYPNAKVNPIGEWTGGTSVDTGITGRKLASDFYGIMKPLGGGTMHGKDLSKADCSVNIYLFLLAQQKHCEFRAICSIGDKYVNINGQLVKFDTIVKTAQKYIESIGGFEKFAEWGLQ